VDKAKLYETIKNYIITQKLKPGQVLNKKDLMEQINVGNTPLREVLFDLQRDGLVSVLPRFGTFVTQLSVNDLRSLIQIRPTLEALVGEILCDQVSAKTLKKIKELLDTSDKVISENKDLPLSEEVMNELRNTEANIHNEMYNGTNNQYLISVCRQLQANTERYWHYANMDNVYIINELADMHQIYESLVTRNKELCMKLMRSHTIEFTNRVLTSLSGQIKPNGIS
jgi:DNA-binding GntR family transcriptional regulator